MEQRRYTWKLYPTAEQARVLHTQRRMVAELWNALLERRETIYSRTQQRQRWWDGEWETVEAKNARGKPLSYSRPVKGTGKWHKGITIHRLTYDTVRYKEGQHAIVYPDPEKPNVPKSISAYDQQNEVTWLLNECPEWRALSCWTPLRTAALVDRAYKAFYARARTGAGAAGYPRFKSIHEHPSIPHRFASGCKIVRDPRHEQSWKVYLKGVSGAIHARGTLPAQLSKWTDADVMWQDNCWWFSAGVEIEARRTERHSYNSRAFDIRFNLVGGFAYVNGKPFTPDGMHDLQLMQDALDRLKAEFETRWPRGSRVHPEEKAMHKDAAAEISRHWRNIRRRRAHILHVWTANVVDRASSIKVTAPAVRSNTQSAKGDEAEWGANVAAVADLNKSVLAYAPAMAIQMLEYKAREAEVECEVVVDKTPAIAIGGELAKAGKTLRKARRTVRRKAA